MAAQRSPEEILVEAGLIGPAQGEAARKRLAERELPPQYFPQAVVESGFAAKGAVLDALAKAWGLPYEDLAASRLDAGGMDSAVNGRNLVPFGLCARKLIAPLFADDSILILACAEPLDELAIDELRLRTNLEIRPKLALAGEVAALLEALDPDRRPVGPGGDIGSIVKELIAEGRIEEAGEFKSEGPNARRILTGGSPPVASLSAPELKRVAAYMQAMRVDFPEALIRLGFASKEAVLGALSKAWGVPAVDFEKELVSIERVRRLRTPLFVWESVLPFDERQDELLLAMSNPRNRLLIERIEEATGRKIAPRLALAQDILRVIRSLPL